MITLCTSVESGTCASKLTIMSKPGTASIGVITDDCTKDNSIVREGILRELTKPNNPPSCNATDASIQTEKEKNAATNHGENDITIEQRLMEIEHECEERLRREMNAKLRLSAKEQAMQAMQKLERKHSDECRFLRKQLAEERSRSKHMERELLQAMSKQQLSGRKELKEVEQKLERERLEKSTLESELKLLNNRMKEFQLSRFSDNEKSERALTTTMKDLEEQKRQFQIEVAEAVRERDLLIHKTKQFEQTNEELLKNLVKTESSLHAKISEVTALRALLKQCQSALESLSYKDESCIPQTSKALKATAQLALTIQPTTFVTKQSTPQELAAEDLQNTIGEKEQRSDPEEMKVTGQYFEKKHLGDPPPCTLLGDPPEEMLALAKTLVHAKAALPKEIELDVYCNNRCGNSTEESRLPMHESMMKLEDTSQSQPDVPESESADNDEMQPEADEGNLEIDCKKLPLEQYPSSNDEAETAQKDESSSAVRADESSEVNDSSSGTDDYSMGSFCTWDQKLDKHGRVNFIHIK